MARNGGHVLGIPSKWVILWIVDFGGTELNNTMSIKALDHASVGTIILMVEIRSGDISLSSSKKQILVEIRHDGYWDFHLHSADVHWDAVTYPQTTMSLSVWTGVECMISPWYCPCRLRGPTAQRFAKASDLLQNYHPKANPPWHSIKHFSMDWSASIERSHCRWVDMDDAGDWSGYRFHGWYYCFKIGIDGSAILASLVIWRCLMRPQRLHED